MPHDSSVCPAHSPSRSPGRSERARPLGALGDKDGARVDSLSEQSLEASGDSDREWDAPLLRARTASLLFWLRGPPSVPETVLACGAATVLSWDPKRRLGLELPLPRRPTLASTSAGSFGAGVGAARRGRGLDGARRPGAPWAPKDADPSLRLGGHSVVPGAKRRDQGPAGRARGT